MDEPNVYVTAGAAAVLATLATLLWQRGVFSDRPFRDAPSRDGRLELYDVLLAFGLCIIGVAAAAGLARILAPPDLPEAQQVVLNNIVMYGGLLPGVAYVFIRAAVAIRGGVLAFGLGFGGSPARVAWLTFIGTLGIVTLTMATSALLVQLTLWIGDQPPTIAHETLLRLREDPTGPAAVAMIVAAVLLAPLLEEILFRGVLQTSLLHTGWIRRRWVVIAAASVIFTVVHIPAMMVPADQSARFSPATAAAAVEQAQGQGQADGQGPSYAQAITPADTETELSSTPPTAQFDDAAAPAGELRLAWQGLPALFVLSLGLGYLYERTGSLWPPIIVHALFNALQIFVALNLVE